MTAHAIVATYTIAVTHTIIAIGNTAVSGIISIKIVIVCTASIAGVIVNSVSVVSVSVVVAVFGIINIASPQWPTSSSLQQL